MPAKKTTTKTHPKHDQHVIHLKIRSLDTIFDARDPEALETRRLNPEWRNYILDVIDTRPRRVPLHLYLEWSTKKSKKAKARITTILRKRLRDHEYFLDRKIKENFRIGRIFLLLGLVVLFFFIGLSRITEQLPLGEFHFAFQEGFLIIGWVALWRPVEILLYEWWPITTERRKIRRLLAGKITLL